MASRPFIIPRDARILVTGTTGLVGPHVVASLIDLGFHDIRCFVRPGSDTRQLVSLAPRSEARARIEMFAGNLLSKHDCLEATRDARIVFHLATGRDGKSYPDAFMNAVVTTRNLLDAVRAHSCLQRFVNVSSLAVYSNRDKPDGDILDERCPVDRRPDLRGDAYSFAKVRQDELVIDYGTRYSIPYVIVRPGYVLGPDKGGVTGRVGIDTFGVFLHLGGANAIPFTYVDNCADAIVLAGLTPGIEGEAFNVVDDDLPSSRRFLRLYKRNVAHFRSLYVPHALSYALCFLWERYSAWSQGQLPPAFNRALWHVNWKRTRYSNGKLKARMGWTPRISMAEALDRSFCGYRNAQRDA